MGIQSSSYQLDAHQQVDGSRWCQETHVTTDGKQVQRMYKLPAGQGDTEAQAKLEAHATYLAAVLAEQEFSEIVNGA